MFPEQVLKRNTIEHKMVSSIAKARLFGAVQHETLLDEWRLWFDSLFIDGNKDFFCLACMSIAHMEEKLEE